MRAMAYSTKGSGSTVHGFMEPDVEEDASTTPSITIRQSVHVRTPAV
jgi:hypothetical protein